MKAAARQAGADQLGASPACFRPLAGKWDESLRYLLSLKSIVQRFPSPCGEVG
jgi:hypothetical protein